MTQETVAKLVDEPQIVISFRGVPDEKGRQELSFQAHVPISVSDHDMDKLVDKLVRVVDRQHAISELRRAEVDKAKHIEQLAALEGQVMLLEEKSKAEWALSGKKGEWTPEKLHPSEKQAHQNTQISANRYRDGIKACEADIARYKPLVNGYASSSAADRNSGMSGG